MSINNLKINPSSPRTIDNSTIGINSVNPIDYRTIDRVLDATADLIQPQYKKWFAKQALRIGADRYMGIASDARTGKNPDRLFVFLLRNA